MPFPTLSEWLRLGEADRRKALSRLAVPEGYRFLDLLSVGDAGAMCLPEYVHKATNELFVLIPGGSFVMGLSKHEESQLRSMEGFNGLDFPVPYELMTPPGQCEVASILVMRSPVTIGLAEACGAVEKGVVDREFRVCFDDDRSASTVTHFTESETKALMHQFGWRLPSDAEWEYMYRAGSKTLFPWGDELLDDDELGRMLTIHYPDRRSLNARSNAFGLAGLQVGERTGSSFQRVREATVTDADRACRGYSAGLWPWQSVGEWLGCVSAMRFPMSDIRDGLMGMRAVVDLA